MKTKIFNSGNSKILKILISTFFFQYTLLAQTSKTGDERSRTIDSLLVLLKTDQPDTNQVNHLNSLCLEYRKIGEYDIGLHYGNAALDLGKKINFPKGIAKSYNILGIIYKDQGNYDKALQNYFTALKIKEEIGYKQGIADSYNNIGIIYWNQGNYDKALENHFTALKIREEIGDKQGIADSYNNIGIIYTDQGNYNKALENHFAALKIRKAMGDKQGIAASYCNMGENYERQSHYDKAIENSFSALKLFEELGDKQDIVASYEDIAKVYTDQLNYTEAMVWFQKALATAKEIGARQKVMEAYKGLADMNNKRGDYRNAYQCSQLYHQYKDSIFNEKSSKQIVEINTKYETEKKEQKIETLTHENTLQKVSNSRKQFIIYGLLSNILFGGTIFFLFTQRRKLRTKNTMANLKQALLRYQMNPHFIFNSLSAIQSFIYKNDKEEASNYLSMYAQLMRLILENSIQDSVSLTNEIDTLQYYLALQKLRFEDLFEYSIFIDPQLNADIIAVPPMLAQPFIENALEHGIKPKNKPGNIFIRFTLQQQHIVFEIEDDGVGLKGKTNEEGIKASRHLGKPTHKSMAVEITRERIALLNKKSSDKITFKIEDLSTQGIGQGVRVSFAIPVIKKLRPHNS